jgi:hypothetical protein
LKYSKALKKPDKTSADFMERIEKQPALLKRFEQLLNIVENSTGDIQKANEAEMRVIKELREMGNEALTAWGEQQMNTLTENYKKKEGCYQAGKKNSAGIRPMGKSQ